jgi:NDP-sugar pyrophosphorylase family protein
VAFGRWYTPPMNHVRALIMAGGKSERMRATAGPSHKALALVRGIALLEWNVRTLLHYGFHDVVVAVNPDESEILQFLHRTAEIARAGGATLRPYLERIPLGNIGAARQVIGTADTLLTLYVDNLAAIDLRALVDHHHAGAFEMTIATHVETFRMPFGELAIRDGKVDAYVEKPAYRIRVSSGTCVLSRRACDTIEPGRMIGASMLFRTLHDAGERIGAFEHEAPWIDINDAAALSRAHRIVEEHWPVFAELCRT